MLKKQLLHLFLVFGTIGYLITLVGCATMSEGQCHTADWYQVGFDDGSRATGSRIDAHYEACSEHKIPVDQAQYRQGYEQGLRKYCTPRNGWLRGTVGTPYSNFCQADLESNFIGAYSSGKDYFRIQQDIRALTDKKLNLEERAVAEGSGLSREDKLEILRQADGIKNQIDGLIYEATNLLDVARQNNWSY